MQTAQIEQDLEQDNYLDLPKKIAGGAILLEGVLNISDVLKGNTDLIEYIAKLHKRGIYETKWHAPRDFEDLIKNKNNTIIEGENEVQNYAYKLIAEAFKRKASDIHIDDYGSYTLIRLRVLGQLEDYTQVKGTFGRQLISTIYQSMTENGGATFSSSDRQDGRISNKAGKLPKDLHSLRVHTEPIQCLSLEAGLTNTMKLRLLYDSTQADGTLSERLDTLGFTPRQISDLIIATNRSGGNFLSGVTGAGKSTGLKHIIEGSVERYPHKSYMSAEDPIEQFFKGVMQILVYTNANLNEQQKIEAFNSALAGQLRSDPNVIIVGEVRDMFSAKSVFNAANGGHTVYTTIHASNALAIPQRLVFLANNNSFDGNILSYICDPNILASLEYQCLVPILCPECKVSFTSAVNDNFYKDMYFFDKTFSKRVSETVKDIGNVFVKGKGCPSCNQRGHIRQKVAAEVVLTDQTLLKHISEGDQRAAYEYFVKEQGGTTFIRNGINLIENGEADPFIVEERLGKPIDFFAKMGIDDSKNTEFNISSE